MLGGREVGSGATTNLPTDGIALSYFTGIEHINANTKRIAYLDSTAWYWNLRTPRTNDSANIFLINPDGVVTYNATPSTSRGMRPALPLPQNTRLTRAADGNYVIV